MNDDISIDALATRRWDLARAKAWDAALPWLVGGNFTPSTASNQLEFWQAATFDPATIDRELGWAADLGMTSMRIFLHDLLWMQDPAGFLDRIDRVLAIAARHRIGALVVFFDSCWHPEPALGPQAEPIPGIHNSRWVKSPGIPLLRQAGAFAGLKGYVQGVLQRFRDDPRIHGWDLWNEPDNDQSNLFGALELTPGKAEAVAPLLAQCFAWAREIAPSQPLTSGVWTGSFASDRLSAIQRLQVSASDVISFHCYGGAESLERCISELAVHGRPMWCTEYMARPTSTFAACLPVFARHRVAAYQWGLVDGRTQTRFAWDSWKTWNPDSPRPVGERPWFHEVLHADGQPYDPAETALIRQTTAARARAERRLTAEG